MLDTIFMRVLDMTAVSSVVILVVLLARLLLKRAPKIFSYALWAVVLFRLLCPVSIQAPVAVVPEIKPVAASYSLAAGPISFAGASAAARQAAVDALKGEAGIQHIHTTAADSHGDVEQVESNWWEVWVLFGQYVWLTGVGAMAAYSLVSLLRLRRRLAEAVVLEGNIYLADRIDTPFVLGLLCPRIYLPAALSEREQGYILLHEQHHIRRGDHLFKAMAFLALCIHWFNPLVWAAFILSAKDMEMSCDEAVVNKLGEKVRGDYSASLLSLATGRRIIAGTPLAFGEGDTGSWLPVRNSRIWMRRPGGSCWRSMAICWQTIPSLPGRLWTGAPTISWPPSTGRTWRRAPYRGCWGSSDMPGRNIRWMRTTIFRCCTGRGSLRPSTRR